MATENRTATPATADVTMPSAGISRAPCLVSLNPALVYREYALDAPSITAGRDAESCDIVCSGATISRRHFRIYAKNGSYYLQDLQSTNGVFVNRRRILTETRLTDGDLIGIGSDSIDHLRFQTETGRKKAWTVELPAKQAWTIGRSPQNDVALAFESAVSWRHATLRPRGGRIEIVDGGSLNGTWLNGRRVGKCVLEPTDAVMIGSTVLRFELLPAGRLRVIRRDCGDEISLECIGLTRQVGGRAGRKILDSVNVCIKPGEFVGLLGPSGAGKSTLLKAINGYNPPGYGCVLLNETPLYRSFDMFRNSIGYVPQDDIVHPELTVESSLDYVARLRLPADVTAEQRRDLIDSTIETLGLSHVRKSRISELSGGQRKRVSIGCELITRPSLLFLDEPTSGMDPSTEERLMRHFQSMARRGTTILITTHILYNLDMLDRVVIMARGRLVFFGTPREAIQFFTIDGKPVDRATQIFDILEAIGAPSGADSKDAVAAEYERKYRESELYKRHVCGEMSEMGGQMLTLSQQDGQTAGRTRDEDTGKTAQRKHLKSLLEAPTAASRKGLSLDLVSPRSLSTLTRRNFAIKLVSLKRALFYLTVPLALALVTLSLRTADFPDDAEMAQKKTEIATQIHGGRIDLGDPIKKLLAPDGLNDPRPAEDVVFNLKHEGLANLPTPMSVLLMFVMTSVFMGTLMSCLDLSTERPIYIRERMANQKIADYVGSKLPFLLAITAVQIIVFLALCRLKPGLRQFDFPSAYLAMVSMAWASCALGLFLSAIDPTAGQFSVVLAIVAVLPQLVFSGGLGPDFYAGMSTVMKGFANALPARWGLEMLTTAFYHHPDRTALEWITRFVPDSIGFDFGPKVYWRDTLVLAGQAFGWLVLCSLALKRLDKAR